MNKFKNGVGFGKLIVLNVAEKPSVAKSITRTLSSNFEVEETKSKYNKLFKFDYQLGGIDTEMWVTSVSGHLTAMEFEPKYQNWQAYDPCVILKDAEIKTFVPKERRFLLENLQHFSRLSNRLILWLDCDREGENIAFEVLNVCRLANPRIEVFRAHFSAVTKVDIAKALNTLNEPDERLSDSVQARQEIDLRIGASFTRFQTLLLKPHFGLSHVVSYGPCQFPTLGFVVQRFKEIDIFVKEKFWSISAKSQNCEFTWNRGNIFDEMVVLILFERCFTQQGQIADVQQKEVEKWKPYPLATIEFEKLASKKLKISAASAMDAAEKLYTKGFISYPRTETNRFPSTMNLKTLLESQKQHPVWGEYARNLIDYNYDHPRGGNKDDKAHPPIHPVKAMNKEEAQTNTEWVVYELITRHFLACCSKNAIGSETNLTMKVKEEQFHKTGLVIKQKNFLEIYPYEIWSQSDVPNFQKGEVVNIELTVKSGFTAPPKPMSESELITLMDKNGIGTDATIHEHIKTIQEREYAIKKGQIIKPTKLGLALVESYIQLGFTLHLPYLRAQMEQRMNNVAQGSQRKEQIIEQTVDEMLVILKELQLKKKQILDTFGVYLEKLKNHDAELDQDPEQQPQQTQQPQASQQPQLLGLCGICDQQMILRNRNLSCETCNKTYKLPTDGTPKYRPDLCPICNFQLLNIQNQNGQSYSICPKCYNDQQPASGRQSEQTQQQQQQRQQQQQEKRATQKLFSCNQCTLPMALRQSKNGNQFIGCSGFPRCNSIIFLPPFIKSSIVTNQTCPKCHNQMFKIQPDEQVTSKVTIDKNKHYCLYPECDRELNIRWHNQQNKSKQVTDSKSKFNRAIRCRKCYQEGHFEDACPQNVKQENPLQFQDQNVKQKKICPSCGVEGRHPSSSNCSLKKGKKKQD